MMKWLLTPSLLERAGVRMYWLLIPLIWSI